MIRYYGLLANRVRTRVLPMVHTLLKQSIKKVFSLKFAYLSQKTLGFNPLRCLLCQQPLVMIKREVGNPLTELRKQLYRSAQRLTA